MNVKEKTYQFFFTVLNFFSNVNKALKKVRLSSCRADVLNYCNRLLIRSRLNSYLLKRGTTWIHLKPRETIWTSWNHMKPPRNYLKVPEPAETIHIIVFLLKVGCSQVEFVLILHPKVFFGQIWSQKLKFSKFTKIWYRGILLYPYFDFDVYFSEIFVINIYLGKFGPKIWSPPN